MTAVCGGTCTSIAIPFAGDAIAISPPAPRRRVPFSGALKHLLSSRFRRSSHSEVLHLQPNDLNQDSPESSPDSRADPVIFTARPFILPRPFAPRAEREAAAASMGLDASTWEALVSSGRV